MNFLLFFSFVYSFSSISCDDSLLFFCCLCLFSSLSLSYIARVCVLISRRCECERQRVASRPLLPLSLPPPHTPHTDLSHFAHSFVATYTCTQHTRVMIHQRSISSSSDERGKERGRGALTHLAVSHSLTHNTHTGHTKNTSTRRSQQIVGLCDRIASTRLYSHSSPLSAASRHTRTQMRGQHRSLAASLCCCLLFLCSIPCVFAQSDPFIVPSLLSPGWYSVSPAVPFTARQGAAACGVYSAGQSRIMLHGGETSTGVDSSLFSSAALANNWTVVASPTSPSLAFHSMHAEVTSTYAPDFFNPYGYKLFLTGGMDAAGAPSGFTFMSTNLGATWTRMNGTFEPRYKHGAVVWNNAACILVTTRSHNNNTDQTKEGRDKYE